MLTNAASTDMEVVRGSRQASRDGFGALGAVPLLDDTAGMAAVGADVPTAGVVGRSLRSQAGRGAGTVVPGCSAADLSAATVSCASEIVFSGVGLTVFIFLTPSQASTPATSSMKTVTMRKLSQRGRPRAWMPSAMVMKMKYTE